MSRFFYQERKYICSQNYIDIQIFPVIPVSKERNSKKKPSSDIQKRLNNENALKKLMRLVHTNFVRNDYEATFTYTDKHRPDDEATAKKQIQNFFRRAKRFYKKHDIELKYIWVMERSEKTGNIHFHAFMSGGVDRTQLEELWGFGYLNTVALKFNEKGVAGLVAYDISDRLLYRRWSCSKNLKKPIVRENNSRITYSKAKKLYAECDNIEAFKKIYPDYQKKLAEYDISEVRAQKNEFNGDYYFTIRLYRKTVRIL